MPKNKLKECIDRTNGKTDVVKADCALFTGLSLRRIQALYSNPDSVPSLKNISKIQDFFAKEWGRDVVMDEIIDNRNSDVLKSVNTILNKVNQE